MIIIARRRGRESTPINDALLENRKKMSGNRARRTVQIHWKTSQTSHFNMFKKDRELLGIFGQTVLHYVTSQVFIRRR